MSLKLFIIANEKNPPAELSQELSRQGFTCSVTGYDNGVIKRLNHESPDLVLLELSSPISTELCHKLKKETRKPVIGLLNPDTLTGIDSRLDIDDFIIKPYNIAELSLRINRLLKSNKKPDAVQLIKYGDLAIDMVKCEVTVGERQVILTFKEYELLKFLASNKGRVLTRETLLDKVWGYDYFGGDRTVDVHIRRLRSKLEDQTHTFIETVRNIGYRFKENF